MDETIPKLGGCLDCGYDLRGLEVCRCPECGRDFDPRDSSTIATTGKSLGPISRWAAAPVRWTVRMTAAVVVMLLWQARFPAEAWAWSPVYGTLWFVLISYWGARLIAQLMARIRVRHAEIRKRIRLPRTALLFGMLVCLAMLDSSRTLSDAAMKLSRPAFERLASSATTEGATFGRWHWVGLYLIKDDHRNRGNVPMVAFNSGEADVHFNLFLDNNSLQCSHGYTGKDTGWMSFSGTPF